MKREQSMKNHCIESNKNKKENACSFFLAHQLERNIEQNRHFRSEDLSTNLLVCFSESQL